MSSVSHSSSASCEGRVPRSPIVPVVYGLSSSVWTRDAGRAMRVARRLQYGAVWVNTHFMITAEMPHGGYKESGYGKDMSMYSLEDYTQIKHVMWALD